MSSIEKKIPPPTDFYLKSPLYESFTVHDSNIREGWIVEYFEGSVDSFCPGCGSHSVFVRNKNNVNYDTNEWLRDHLFSVSLQCSRNKEHHLYFMFQLEGRVLQKIGQFPSIAALHLFDVKKYSTALEKRYFQELTRAIGLAAHGVGVGSFVYLRRIFEHLVELAHQQALSDGSVNEEEFQSSRIVERIKMLNHKLPDFLVQNRMMYGILSKGIHELTEDECLNAFPVVKIGIEIILDAKLEAIEKEKKIAEAQKAIQLLGASIKS